MGVIGSSILTSYYIGRCIGTMIGGAIMGLIPLFIALIKRRGKAGAIALLACALSALLGGIVSITVFIVSLIVVICLYKEDLYAFDASPGGLVNEADTVPNMVMQELPYSAARNKKKQIAIIAISVTAGLILGICLITVSGRTRKQDSTFEPQRTVAANTETEPTEMLESGTGDQESQEHNAAPISTDLESTEEAAGDSMMDIVTDLTLYSLDDIGLFIKIPSELNVLTRGMNTETEWMIMNGIALDDVSDMFDDDLYLLAVNEGNNLQITVRCAFDDSFIDLREMSDSELRMQVERIEQDYRSAGAAVIENGIYQSDWANFTRTYYTVQNDGSPCSVLSYHTWCSDRHFTIVLRSDADELTSYEKDVLQLVADSICFTDELNTDDKVLDDNTSRYENQETGISFIIPDGWNRQDKDIGIKLVPDDDNYTSLDYDYGDILEGQESYLRKDVDNSYMSQDEIAELMNVSADSVSEVTYGDEVYYNIKLANFVGKETLFFLVKIDNGYTHVFRFIGEKDSTYYQDFEHLMQSIEYPDVSAGE